MAGRAVCRGAPAIFRHVFFGADDPEQARIFYDATFGALDIGPGTPDAKGRYVYRHGNALFVIGRPIDGQPATHANGGTLGLFAPSQDALMAWYAAGLDNGGLPCEGEPTHRISPATGREIWIAYLRDPTGNELCAVYEVPE
ncbi:catechol 2,3-dioxygenase-like lactoylglutathione lyase family enzyme [Altererythrobacter atlanticus]|uniref:Glyoxalase-like domain protein n=1 Tax=Croceibacterium atlanticum TaxID=1267766 RepID=A0A0F7KVR8_9SPHN|nr:VOC family protein [Croceibacterium atlanticum]AKH43809.1 Glyoxalase-like domain protein [Croceibacterium atlanticum]MBB5733741.1 catechol 2,3-dioxygenase-like lactoylglutathione lyase family enzyme [Croceibacterium atlanticum]